MEGETEMIKEMPREGKLAKWVGARIPPAEDRAIAGAVDIRSGEPDVDPGVSGNPVKFAVRAVFYYAGKTADKIISLYSRAFRLDREYVADFSRSTGMAHAKRGRWEKAIPLLEKALAIAPDDQETRMHLARACGAANQYEKAHEHLGKALEANPNSGPALRALGILCSRRQDYERAIQYLKRAVELDPDHAQAFYRLGAAYDNRKLYDRAVESFKEAIRLDPRCAKPYQALGFTYESMGDRESAVECFKKALELE
jgi:tetratricopeptide (TPR) repeat protein